MELTDTQQIFLGQLANIGQANGGYFSELIGFIWSLYRSEALSDEQLTGLITKLELKSKLLFS